MTETISLALILVSQDAFVEPEKVSWGLGGHWCAHFSVSPLLQAKVTAALDSAASVIAELAESHPSEAIRHLSGELRVALATLGHVGSVPAPKTGPSLVQELPSASEAELTQALLEAAAGLIPNRGHALLVLARAVEERRPEVRSSLRPVMVSCARPLLGCLSQL